MLHGIFNSTNIPVLEKIAAFAERRQEILAGNLANIDTPEYKTRDLPVAEFQAALEQAIHGRQNASATSVSSSQYRHLGSGASLAELFPDRIREMEELRAKSGGITLNGAGNALASPGGQRPGADDVTRKLKEAKELLDAGAISDAEYETIKARVLNVM